MPGLETKGGGTEEEVECVMELQPAITWTSLGDDIDYGVNALLDELMGAETYVLAGVRDASVHDRFLALAEGPRQRAAGDLARESA